MYSTCIPRGKSFYITDAPQKDKWITINGTRWNLYNNAKDALTNFNSASTRNLMAGIGLLQSGSPDQVEKASRIHILLREESRTSPPDPV